MDPVLAATLAAAAMLQAAKLPDLNERLGKSAVEQLRIAVVQRPGMFQRPARRVVVMPEANRKCAAPLLEMRIPHNLDPSMMVKPPGVAVPMPQVALPAPSCDNQAALGQLTLSPRDGVGIRLRPR